MPLRKPRTRATAGSGPPGQKSVANTSRQAALLPLARKDLSSEAIRGKRARVMLETGKG